MASEQIKRDDNRVVVLAGVTDDANKDVTMLRVDPTTKRLKVSATGIGAAITAKDEGVSLTASLASVDFVGAGVTATAVGNDVTVTIPGVSAGATAALDNLAAVAINASLTPGTAGAVHVGSATKPVGDIFLAGTSGTPGTNNFKITGASTSGLRTVTLPDASGTVAMTADKLSAFAATTSAELAGVVSDETGSGSLVFATSPTLVTPTIGVATATSVNKVAVTAPASAATLTLADGSTLATSGAYSTTLTATGATNVTLPTTGTLATLAGSETLTNKTLTTPVIASISNSGTITVPTGTDTLVGKATTDTLTNKTLTAPKFADGGFIADANGNEEVIFVATASAVNEVTITNAATGTTGPLIAASGETNVDLRVGGKGTGKVAMQSSVNFGDKNAYFTEHDDGNSSTADTIDWTLSNKHKSTLTGNCTYTFTAPNGPCNLVLKLVQDGTGSRTVTWPAAVHWSGGTAPTLTTTASKVDIVSFYYDGSTYFGQAALNFTA